jgi:hypothetical protein
VAAATRTSSVELSVAIRIERSVRARDIATYLSMRRRPGMGFSGLQHALEMVG